MDTTIEVRQLAGSRRDARPARASSQLFSRIAAALRTARFDGQIDEWERTLEHQPRRLDADRF